MRLYREQDMHALSKQTVQKDNLVKKKAKHINIPPPSPLILSQPQNEPTENPLILSSHIPRWSLES
jgi:hypothetical protein